MSKPVNPGDKAVTATIILTNYNHAKYLDCSLSGIVNQSRPADEIIVIDDGSTDNSLEIIEDYARRYPQIHVLKNGQNKGVQYSIARAMGAVTSDWLAWAAADDKLLPDFLARNIAMIEKYPETGLVFSELATFHDETGEETYYSHPDIPGSAFHIGHEHRYYTTKGMMKRLEDSYLWLSGNTVLVRKTDLLDVGAFIPQLEWHSDWYAFYAVALRHGAVGIPEALAMMRVVPETYSSAGMKDKKRQRMVMTALLDILRRPENVDIRRKIRARPCIVSPFRHEILSTLLRTPRDFSLLIRLLSWKFEHRVVEARSRLAGVKFPRGLRTRIFFGFYRVARKSLNMVTRKKWRTG